MSEKNPIVFKYGNKTNLPDTKQSGQVLFAIDESNNTGTIYFDTNNKRFQMGVDGGPYVPIAGGTMTGPLTTTQLTINRLSNDYPTINFVAPSRDSLTSGFVQTNTNGVFGFYSYHTDQDQNSERYYTGYALPGPDAGLNSSNVSNGKGTFYNILTSKDPVTVAQGGTGATTAAGARTALGITPANIGAVKKTGDTMTGSLTLDAGETSTPPTVKVNRTVSGSVYTTAIWISQEGNGSILYNKDGITLNRIMFYSDKTTLSQPLTIESGGTGATTAAEARTNLNAVNKSGDTMTGQLTATRFVAAADWPTYAFYKNSESREHAFIQTTSDGALAFYTYGMKDNVPETKWTGYTLPGPDTGLTDTKRYDILTTKNIITTAQGGTGKNMSGASANAIVRMSSTGATFDHTPSANGAVYATSANGAITFGTLPVAQGGTGKTSFTSGQALIGNGTGGIVTRSITNNTTVGPLASSWSNSTNLVTLNTLAYWDGSRAGNSSNLSKLGTVTNGTWQANTIAVDYGGTGATTPSAACENLGAVKKSGDTMTGTLTAPYIKIYSASWPSLSFGPDANTGTGSIYQAMTSRKMGINQYAENSAYSEHYLLPAPSVIENDHVWYNILTSKHAVTVAQGGTGAKTFTSGHALIGNGTGAIATRAITNNTSVGPLNASGWTASQTYATALPTLNTLAYWDGAYAGNNSNLTKLGTITKGAWNATVISTTYGGTGQNMSTAPTNALIRMSNQGTFWYTASASGAVYATSANGAITFGTLPIAQGGTGATTKDGACESLGAVKKSGDAMTGTLVVPYLTVKHATSFYPTIDFKTSGGQTGVLLQPNLSNGVRQFSVYQYPSEMDSASTIYYEAFKLPMTSGTLTGNKAYGILTTKNTVTVAQGGTGVTTKQDLRNLVYNSYSDAGIDNTVDIFTLAPGIYHLEDTSSTDKNYPIAEARATIFVYGQHRAGTAAKEDGYPNGYWLIRIFYGSGKEYINFRYWSNWTGWKRVYNDASVIPVSNGGTGQDMSAAPGNALVRTSNAGTLWYTASANGAVYATSANGAITFGTLPVAQGGTGATSKDGALTNLGALPLAGGTMTGTITLHSTGFKTSNSGGYYTNQYGNFVHQVATTNQTWNICNNAGASKFAVDFESGYVTAKGLVNGTPISQNWILTSRSGAFRVETAATGSAAAAALSMKVKDGSWAIANLATSSSLYFVFGSDENYNAGTNKSSTYYIGTDGIYSGYIDWSHIKNPLVTVAQGGTGATDMLGAQANLLTTDSSKITATTNLNTILQTGRFKMEGNASKTYNWPADAGGARCLIIQEGALNNNTYGYWKQTAHMLGQNRTYSRNYHWDHWMAWNMDYNEETLVYSTSQPTNGYKGRIWLKPIN